MGVKTMSDFVVGSNGYCFFCLNQIMPVIKRESASEVAKQVNSLQYLSRYLKMDQKKVFIDEGQVSPELLAKVEKGKLKVELCEDCSCLNEKFSEGYRQLEKLELELGSTLRLIHGKLISADAKTLKPRSSTAGFHSDWDGLLEVLDILRVEALQKSTRKLADTPRVKIQNLSKEKIRAKQFRLGNYLGSDQKRPYPAASRDLVSDPASQQSGVKMEEPLSDGCVSDTDNGNYFSDTVDCNLDHEPLEDDDSETHQEKIEANIKLEIVNGSTKCKEMTMAVVQNVVSRTARNKVENGSGKSSINPNTGKRKCNICYKEFNTQNAFTLHYQAVHLKVRFKCVTCNKLFSQNSNLRLHQRTSRSCAATESAPKYNCHLCEKRFSLRQQLQRHLDGVHYKLQKYECDLCEKRFNTDWNLHYHRRREHRDIKRSKRSEK